MGREALASDNPVTVHVGYHKTGTSWLQRAYFPSHPQVQPVCNSVAPMEDAFLSYLIATSDWKFDPQHARMLFDSQAVVDGRHLVVSAERLSGHPYSGGFDQVRLAGRVHATLPAARILVVIRDQEAMLESVYRQLVESGYPGSFASLLENDGWTTPWFEPAMYEYDLVLEQYHRIFGPDRVLMARYEVLRADPDAFTARVCAFMGIPFLPGPQARVNRTVSAELMLFIRWLNRFRRSERNRWPLVPLPSRLIGAVAAKGGRLLPATGRKLLSEQERAWIRRHYAESNGRLAAMLDSSDPS